MSITDRGFTLIEVLVALVIVSLGMLGVIQAVGQTASNTSYLRDKTVAHWVAMNRLTEARLQDRPPEIDETSDEVDMAGRRWRWTMQVTQTEVQSMRRIDIRVRPADADENTSLASLTGFYGTAVAPPGRTVVMWDGSEQRRRGRRAADGDDEERDGRRPRPRDRDDAGSPPPDLEPPPPEDDSGFSPVYQPQ